LAQARPKSFLLDQNPVRSVAERLSLSFTRRTLPGSFITTAKPDICSPDFVTPGHPESLPAD
jgi:hypothetical protein